MDIRPIRILLIEDNPDDASLLHNMLNKAGSDVFDLEWTDNLPKGLECLNKRSHDVVLLDLGLPGSRGIDTLITVRDSAAGIPIIAITGLANETVGRSAVRQGAQDFLVKEQTNGRDMWRAIQHAIDRKKTSDELREAEERYQTLLENADEMISSLAPDGRLLYVNKAWLEKLGYSQGAALNLHMPNVMHASSLLHYQGIISGVMSGRSAKNIRLVLMSKGGKPVPVSGSVTPHFREGRVIAIQGIFRDVTEMERAEELFKILAHNATTGIYIVQDRRFCFANRHVCQAIGLPEEELLGREALEIVVPEDKFNVRASAVAMLKGQSFAPYQYRIMRPEGDIRWIIESVVPIEYQGRRAVLGSFMDITEYKQTMLNLQVREREFQKLFEAMAQGVVYHDAEGKVISANPSALKILGLRFEQISRTSLINSGWDAIDEDGARVSPINHPAMVALRTGREVKDVVLGFFNPSDHNRRWIRVNAVPEFQPGERTKPYQVFTTFDDFTARKEMEQNLRDSEAFNAGLLENAPNPVLVSDADHSVTYVNPAFEKLTGYSRSEIKGQKGTYPWWPEESIEQYRGDNLAGIGQAFNLTERLYRKKTGELFYAAVTTQNVTDLATGNIKVHIANWLDISDRKKTETQLIQSEEKLRRVFSSISDGILIADIRGNILDCNDNILTMLKAASKHEVTGKNTLDFISAEFREIALMRRLDALRNRTNYAGQYMALRLDGTTFPAEASSTTARDDSGAVLFRVISVRDVTEPQRAELALRTAKDFAERIFNNIQDPVSIIDLKTFKVIDANQAYLNDLGLKKEDVIGKPCHQFCQYTESRCQLPDDPCPLVDLIKEEKTSNLEYAHRKTSNQIRFVEVSAEPIRNERGEVIQAIHTVRDVTERKNMEDALWDLYETEKHERQELQKEAQARSQFITVLGHELRTPLTPLLVSVETLHDFLNYEPASVEGRLVNAAVRSSKLLAERLEELLDLAHLSRGTFKLQTRPVQVRECLEIIAGRFAPVLKNQEQQLILEISPDLPVVEADPSRLDQVVTNLLSNASKYSGKGKSLTLRAGVYDGQIQIEVEDHGIGISDEDQQRLFEPYHRAEQDRQRFPGLGLGMAISRQIIEAHGGKLWVTSDPGKGSTFSFTIPIKQLSNAN